MTFILEHFTLVSLWLVKACLLIIYNRLTYASSWVDTLALLIVDTGPQVGFKRAFSSEGACCLRCGILCDNRDSLLHCLVWSAHHHVLCVPFLHQSLAIYLLTGNVI